MTPPFDSSFDAQTSLPALVAAGVQPGWVVLNCARDKRFTGQIVFCTQPEIEVYFDCGIAYHAVSAGDQTLSEQLVASGVVVPAQIERGTVRVGNVEHLGRLFDRDSSIERDSVMVVLELATDEVIATIANHPPTNFSVTAYRHHVSGIHRWFLSSVAPSQRPSIADLAEFASTAGAAQRVNSVTRDTADASDQLPVDEVSIEWDHPIEPEGRRTTLCPVEEVLRTPQPEPAAEWDFQLVWPGWTTEPIPHAAQFNVEGVAIETHEPIARVQDLPAGEESTAIAEALGRLLALIEHGSPTSAPVNGAKHDSSSFDLNTSLSDSRLEVVAAATQPGTVGPGVDMPMAAPVVEVPAVEPLAASARADKPAHTPVAAAAFAPAKPATRAGGFPAPTRGMSAEVLRPAVAAAAVNDSDSVRSGALHRLIESLRRN